MEKLTRAIEYIKENIDTDQYDLICDDYNKTIELDGYASTPPLDREGIVKAAITEVLDYAAITDDADLDTLKADGSDLWNDKNKDGNYFCDLSSEWADNEVDIYNYTLWQKWAIFSEAIEDSISELGSPEPVDMIKILQQGQYYFWSQFSGAVLNKLKTFIDDEMDEEDEETEDAEKAE